MRLIDADKACESLDELFECIQGDADLPACVVKTLIRNMLKSERVTPTVDPVKYGVWKEETNDKGFIVFRCSRCGIRSVNKTWYCHYCGANMAAQ